jgi:hypothetical protein
MDDPRSFVFYSNNIRKPYIQELIDYNIDNIKQEGHIQFNGYFYVDDSEFPINMCFITQLREDMPSKTEILATGGIQQTFNILETNMYHVEFYKRETIEDTSVTSVIEDEDGEEMNVCFFPTAQQKIYFRVLNKFDDNEQFIKVTDELYSTKSIKEDEKGENIKDINHRPREIISELLDQR